MKYSTDNTYKNMKNSRSQLIKVYSVNGYLNFTINTKRARIRLKSKLSFSSSTKKIIDFSSYAQFSIT